MGEFVGQRLWPGTEIANSIQDYYQDRFEALVRAVRLGERMVETRIYGLMLRAADLVGRFRGSPDTVTLGNYARLLAECMTYPVEEFQLALLAALGFGARVQDFVVRDRIRFPTDRAEKLIDISRRKTTAGERVLLVLRDPPVVTQIGEERVIQAKLPASSYAEWFASKQHAVFPVFAGSQAMLPPLVDGVFTLVLLDGYCDVISTAQPTNAFITAFLLSSVVPKVRLVNKGDIADASAQLPRLFPTGVPELTEMQFLDDTISQARRVLPSPAATSVTAGVG